MDDSVNNNTELTTQKNDEMEVEESEKDSSFSKTLRSYVWNHCTKRTPNIAICNLCKGEFNTTSGSTSTLLRHLNSKHKSAVDNYKIDVESKNKSFTKDSLKAKEMTKALSLLVTVGLQPSSILNEQTFINFTKVAEPRFSIPTVEEFSSKIIPDLFNEEKERFKDIVGKDFKEGQFKKINLRTFI
ncbi:uncharacterized protein LOC122502182 [Leptopilina heterotoma]|uniref:uncharacterized protein LOC122502182 n=1 Tax=Leptopilina heterotoma TaxID=63436 RepID=UPI001CA7B78E|nr:uncharacterized protein LOC122502182 [Leptopilina heterotoma]